jgi:hypothetical protein
MKKIAIITAVALALGTGLGACEEEGPAEELGEKLDEGAEETGEAIEEGGENMAD